MFSNVTKFDVLLLAQSAIVVNTRHSLHETVKLGDTGCRSRSKSQTVLELQL